ncbi:MAG TPA: hypothetical protein VIO57_11415 [Chloroflexota bacterium]
MKMPYHLVVPGTAIFIGPVAGLVIIYMRRNIPESPHKTCDRHDEPVARALQYRLASRNHE